MVLGLHVVNRRPDSKVYLPAVPLIQYMRQGTGTLT